MSTESQEVDGEPQGDVDELLADDTHSREIRSLPIRRVVISVAAVCIAAVLLGWTYVQDDHQSAELEHQSAQIEALYAALGDEQSNAEAQGVEPVAPDPEEILEDPSYSPQPGPSGPPGPGPSDAQVRAAVAAYLSDNPITSEGPSSAEIATAVANYLSDYPPGPTPEQVASAVASYLTENPPAAGDDGANGSDGSDGAPGPPGPEGPQGEPGPPPSAEDVAAAVQEWMEQNEFPDFCHEKGWVWEPYTVVTTAGGVDTVLCVPA